MSLLTLSAFRVVNGAVESLVKAGVGSPLRVGGGVVVLETTGRSSGKRRSVPVLSARIGNRVAVSTVRSDSDWLRNLEEDPAVGVWLGGQRHDAVARVSRGRLNVVTLQVTDPAGP